MSMPVGKWIAGACVFIGVMSLLAAIVGAFGIMTRRGNTAYTKTEAILKMLDDARQAYRLQHGKFPPSAPDGNSAVLVRLLGSPRQINGVQRPPFIEFGAGMLAAPGGPVTDGWGRPIKYRNPGVRNPKGVDLWSSGRNGRDEGDPNRRDFDDVTNRVRIEG